MHSIQSRVGQSIVLVALIFVTACASPSAVGPGPDSAVSVSEEADTPVPQSLTVWDHLRLDGAEDATPRDSVAQIAIDSDTVVRGRFESFEAGEMFQGEEPEDRTYYVDGLLSVDEVLSGSTLESPIRVAFLVIERGEPIQLSIKNIVEADRDGEVIAFIHERDDRPGEYRLFNRYGLWTTGTDGSLITPLGDFPAAGSEMYSAELSAISSLDALGGWIQSLR